MRQEYQLVGLAVVALALAVPFLLVPDLREVGWYVLGMAALTAASAAWFLVRGGNVPHPPPEAELPRLPAPAPAAGGCPKCGGRSRPMTGAETTAFYGYDRLVLARPRMCLGCGHGFEAQPSRAGCYLMVAVAAAGGLAGLVFIAAGPWVLWQVARDPAVDGVERAKGVLAAVVLPGFGGCFVWRSWKIGSRYWHLKDRA